MFHSENILRVYQAITPDENNFIEIKNQNRARLFIKYLEDAYYRVQLEGRVKLDDIKHPISEDQTKDQTQTKDQAQTKNQTQSPEDEHKYQELLANFTDKLEKIDSTKLTSSETSLAKTIIEQLSNLLKQGGNS